MNKKPNSSLMKTSTQTIVKLSAIVLLSSGILISCSPSSEYMSNKEESAKVFADSVSTVIQNIPQTQQPIKHDSNRVFVRKADLYFKVKDVKNATFDIERIVSQNNGYVTSSMLESNTNFKNSIRISKDSVQDIINYTVHNDLILRIPNDNLDKTLTEIASLIDYLDFRKIKANDVTKQFQSAKLSENRFVKHKKRVEKAIDDKGKKLNETLVEAENDLLVKQEWADDSKLNTLELAHDVAYSTVTISIYQKETTKKETYAYSMPIEPYKPNFGSKLLTSLADGGEIFGEIILFFIRLWPIALVIIGLVVLIKFILKRKWFTQ